ncbi:EthD family reductase [Hyphomonas sp.]|uniref:EthD family reductase n=1 Tax=Hyphomonas sp. TaxID=87 RepID=UPI0025BA91FA|nr:EthD family reductase [Hyphomonas sp.]
MYKLIVLYKKPQDTEAFFKYYHDVHLPLVRKIPGLERIDVNQVTGSPMGGDPEYFLIVEMCYPDKDTFVQAMKSPENLETGKDVANFAAGLVTVVTAVQQ